MSAKEDLFGQVPKTERVFIPHPECMVPSGECLNVGRCLAKCKTRAFYEHQKDVRELGSRIAQLERQIIMLTRNQKVGPL